VNHVARDSNPSMNRCTKSNETRVGYALRKHTCEILNVREARSPHNNVVLEEATVHIRGFGDVGVRSLVDLEYHTSSGRRRNEEVLINACAEIST
jgi:hypothetical protein